MTAKRELTEQEIESVLAHMVSGNGKDRAVSLVSVLKDHGISYSCWQRRCREDPELATRYRQAREDRADYLADEIVEIADSETDANRARVRVDARKWVASRLRPGAYGDQLNVEHSGAIDTTGLTGADLLRLAETLAVEQARRKALTVDDEGNVS